jgi:hypothetical protein
MPATEIRVEVLLCPDKELEGAPPHPSWPRLAGAKVEFRKDGAPVTDVIDAVTDADGLAASGELEPGAYNVSITPDASLGSWTLVPAGPLKVSPRKARAPQQFKLVPPVRRRLLALLLCGEGPGGKQVPLAGAEVHVGANPFTALDDGHVYALVPHVRAMTDVTFDVAKVGGWEYDPPDKAVAFEMPEPDDREVEIPVFSYAPTAKTARGRRGIFITPEITTLSGKNVALTGARVTVEQRSGTSRPAAQESILKAGEEVVSFPNLDPGSYLIKVNPPEEFDGWKIRSKPEEVGPRYLRTTDLFEKTVEFKFDAEQISGIIQAPGDRPLDEDLQLEIYGTDGWEVTTAKAGKFTADVPSNSPLRIRLVPGLPPPTISGVPLEMVVPDQRVETPPQPTKVLLQYQHSVTGRAVDESHTPIPGAVIILYDGSREAGRAVAGDDGSFLVGVRAAGSYSLAIQTEGGAPVTQRSVSVRSTHPVGDLIFWRWQPPGGGPSKDGNQDDPGADRLPREAFTDLAAYPVLTEEISTTGVPAPVSGGTAGGIAGAGYGQVVDQAMRDVLGWRPGGDVAGFQAALTGAFQLREVEGHTAWAWQQRGYAVQADMGALTGAQASIYARAKSALDQVQPLLAGLTTLNPALYEPQDLETIRTVVATEFQELVSELALEGGPRIQRVDELFRLLLGEGRGSRSMDPDRVQGNLGILRERFALTVDEIQTVDEERIVTNFRIIVEQVLALFRSWQFDRGLLSGVGTRTALGTILIWLSRGLEAVGESVGDLMFALDSVFVDAAQRQVIELRFAGVAVKDVPEVPLQGNPPQTTTQTYGLDEPPMFLSDLLDWVLRACRDEGPKMVQDAGKQGVLAFKPVLNTLRILVRATGQIAHERGTHGAMPAGMRTPRVERAIKVLAAQLDEAANLASLVRAEDAPQIAYAQLLDGSTLAPVNLAGLKYGPPTIEIMLAGSNFRGPARAQLTAEDNEDLPGLGAVAKVNTPSAAGATFANPGLRPENAGTTWQVQLTNADGTQSNQIEVLRVPR